MNTLKNKAGRPWGRRMAAAAVPAFLLMFTVVFFGPLDITNANQHYLTFTAADLFWPLLGLMLAGTLLLSALAALLRGRAFDVVLGLLLALAVMLWLQGLLPGRDLGTLDGSGFRWQDEPLSAVLNLVIWVVAAALGIIAALRWPAVFRTAAAILCAALCLAQTAALVTTWEPGDDSGINYQLDGSDQFVLSEDENIVVITLDQVAPDLFEEVLAMDPELEDVFRDFLYYDNMSGSYALTFPSLCALLTGQMYDGSQRAEDYLYEAWHSDTADYFYDTLHENGYSVGLFLEANYAAYTAENMLGKADNVVQAGRLIPSLSLLRSVIRTSLYRYSPEMLKNAMYVSTGGILDMSKYQGVGKLSINYDFYYRLRREGLSTGAEGGRFVWYHTQGAHFPFWVNYDGTARLSPAEETAESRLNQLHGYLVAVAEYLEQMKQLGIYDDATIIVSADHGYYQKLQTLFLIKTPGQSFEIMQRSSAPVAQEDVLATILDVLGEDYSLLGRSVFDVAEDETRVRRTLMWGYHSDYPEVPWVGNVGQWDNEANGSERYNVLAIFEYEGDRDDIANEYGRWYYWKEADGILPLTDSFY